jgi:hypothetical protein
MSNDGENKPRPIARTVAAVVAVASGAATIYGMFTSPRVAVLAILGMALAMLLFLVVNRAVKAVGASDARFYDVLVKVLVVFAVGYFVFLMVGLFPSIMIWLRGDPPGKPVDSTMVQTPVPSHIGVNEASRAIQNSPSTPAISTPAESKLKSSVAFSIINVASDRCFFVKSERGVEPNPSDLLMPSNKQGDIRRSYKLSFEQEYPRSEEERRKEGKATDPILDVTMVNRGDGAGVVSEVGFTPVAVWTEIAGIPIAEEIPIGQWVTVEVTSFKIDEPIGTTLKNPLYIPPNGVYRFQLHAKGFLRALHKAHGNACAIKLFVKEDGKFIYSEEFEIGGS